jgi:hypothetical protein
LKLENLDGILTDWVDEPIGTASIGQVYKAGWSLSRVQRCSGEIATYQSRRGHSEPPACLFSLGSFIPSHWLPATWDLVTSLTTQLRA